MNLLKLKSTGICDSELGDPRAFPQLSGEGVTMTPFIWIKEGK